jgi:hypothetical protein
MRKERPFPTIRELEDRARRDVARGWVVPQREEGK